MRSYLVLLGLLAWSIQLSAQFDGGSGEGSDQRTTIQLDLSGIPSGIRPLYAGGRGDGHDNNTTTVGLAGQPGFAIYGGGDGDGFSKQSASATLSGVSVVGLYRGGSGDGFSQSKELLSLNGLDASILFQGGMGDGYADNQASFSLNGVAGAQLYGGGPGDGFSRLTHTSGLMGESALGLYGGGSGDGYDDGTAFQSLGGQDLGSLYGGGGGDGFDRALYFGAIPLPLTLISFSAYPEEEYVLLKWVTEDEVDTDFFTIEKTQDGSSFTWVGEETAAGNSEPGEQLHYEMRDFDPYEGTSFYRLKTTDFDGAISFSQLVSVHYAQADQWNFQLFPNPNTGQHFSLNLDGVQETTDLQIEMLDVNGRSILRQGFQGQAGESYRFDLDNRLSTGSYLIRVHHPERGTQAKILIVQ